MDTHFLFLILAEGVETDPDRVSFIVGDEDDNTSIDEASDKQSDKLTSSGSFTLMEGSSSGRNSMEPAGFSDRRRRLR